MGWSGTVRSASFESGPLSQDHSSALMESRPSCWRGADHRLDARKDIALVDAAGGETLQLHGSGSGAGRGLRRLPQVAYQRGGSRGRTPGGEVAVVMAASPEGPDVELVECVGGQARKRVRPAVGGGAGGCISRGGVVIPLPPSGAVLVAGSRAIPGQPHAGRVEDLRRQIGWNRNLVVRLGGRGFVGEEDRQRDQCGGRQEKPGESDKGGSHHAGPPAVFRRRKSAGTGIAALSRRPGFMPAFLPL